MAIGWVGCAENGCRHSRWCKELVQLQLVAATVLQGWLCALDQVTSIGIFLCTIVVFCICLFLNMLQYIYICMSWFVLWNMLVFCVFASCLFSFMKKLVNHTACILIYALVDEYRGLYYPRYWYIADFNNPIGESLLTNQYDGMIDGFWTLLTCSNTAKWILLAISPLGPHSSTTNIPPFYHHFP